MVELVVGAALVGLLLSSKRKAGASAPAQSPNPQQGGSTPKPGVNAGGIGAGLATIGAESAGVYAAGIALSYAGGQLGQALTQDKGIGLYDAIQGKTGPVSVGKLTGELNPILGTAANLGRVVGKAIDLGLGGTEGDAPDLVAQYGLGATAVMGEIFGTVASVAFVIFTAAAYGVTTVISDLERLSYGQKGAAADYDKQWFGYWSKFSNAAQGIINVPGVRVTAPGGLDYPHVLRIFYPFTDGYMHQVNRLAWLQWMRKPHGIGQSDHSHAVYGRDRGCFVGDSDGVDLTAQPLDKSADTQYLNDANVPTKSRRGETRLVVARYDTQLVESNNPLTAQTCAILKAQGVGPTNATYRSMCMAQVSQPVFDEQTVWVDVMRDDFYRSGRLAANAAAYADWCREFYEGNHGITLDIAGHVKWGFDQGRFEGTLLGDGRLRADGMQRTSTGAPVLDSKGRIQFAQTIYDARQKAGA